jgi:RNA polymerase sporulation-specific sigma factor
MAKSSKRIQICRPIEGLDNEALVDIVRTTKNKKIYNESYNIIENRIRIKIMFIIRQFFIPGFNYEDIFQEALYALRYKAIPDYDRSRGRDNRPYPFEKFAMLCIRRHLSTILKCAFQNKKKALNTSLSLDQDRGSPDDNLFLADILPKTTGTVVDKIGEVEYNKELFGGLFKDLSILEKRVFKLYACRYSYEEISVIINNFYKKRNLRKRTDVKSIDNALSRIKQKARQIYLRHKDEDKDN